MQSQLRVKVNGTLFQSLNSILDTRFPPVPGRFRNTFDTAMSNVRLVRSPTFWSVVISGAAFTSAGHLLQAQVNITTGSYQQDFGTSDITTWTNNVTIPGWYAVSHLSNISGVIPHENITNSAPTNTGNFYSYECNGNNDQKIGARPSNSIPGTTGRNIRYGVYLRNTTGQTITSVRVQYEGFQLSLAENVGTTNMIEFHYAIAAGLPSMTAAGIAFPALNYVAPNNDPGPGNSSQLVGYPCTVSEVLSSCIPVTWPNNAYLLLRWSDQNDAQNDPHLAIDNVTVDFGINSSTSCDILLPVELIRFSARPEGRQVRLDWSTASERENDHFTVERSTDGREFAEILRVLGAGTSMQLVQYSDVDPAPFNGLNYYRLRQTDLDGTSTLSSVVGVLMGSASSLSVHASDGMITAWHGSLAGSEYNLRDMTGRLIGAGKVQEEGILQVPASDLPHGVYLLTLRSGARQESMRFVF